MTKRILIADDDRDLVHVLSTRCQRSGLAVLTAYDAASALQLAQREAPDIICIDVQMPAGNGLSVCEMLRTDPRSESIPLIIMTGRSDPDTIRRCHNLCVFYVQKSNDLWNRLEPLIAELLSLNV